MTLKRRHMREENRNKVNEAPKALAETKAIGESSEKFIRNMLKRFEESYNGFLKSGNNVTPALEVHFEMDISKTSIPEAELVAAGSVPYDLLRTALRDPGLDGNPGNIQVMYLRIDKITQLKADHNLKARPGAAEKLENNTLVTLLYHAAVLLTEPAPNSALDIAAHLELEMAAAKRNLTDDAITHFFCNGIQYQESSNERQWQMENKMQMQKMKQKTKEVNDIFEEAINMKVNGN